jgi:uncharacterized metal-binding protein (TIGR02443 family)
MAGHRKFIAGAVCPQCEKMDKLFVDDDPTVARCAACGYEMTQPQNDDVEPPQPKPVEQAVTLVNFDNKKDS